MPKPSTLRVVYDNLNRLPAKVRDTSFTAIFNAAVKYAGTTGIRYQHISPERSVVTLKNRKRVQNHIGSVHAVAMTMIGETATGSIVALNVNSDQLPVIKTMKIDFVKRAVGDMRAEAWLTPEQIELIQTTDKGEVEVGLTITDAEGKEPVLGTMLWAWTPKLR